MYFRRGRFPRRPVFCGTPRTAFPTGNIKTSMVFFCREWRPRRSKNQSILYRIGDPDTPIMRENAVLPYGVAFRLYNGLMVFRRGRFPRRHVKSKRKFYTRKNPKRKGCFGFFLLPYIIIPVRDIPPRRRARYREERLFSAHG